MMDDIGENNEIEDYVDVGLGLKLPDTNRGMMLLFLQTQIALFGKLPIWQKRCIENVFTGDPEIKEII